jgi:ribosome maturation factor RimP
MGRKRQVLSPETIAEIRQSLFQAIESTLEERFYLVEVAVEEEARQWYVRLYVEGKGFRISVDECALLSQQLDPVLETLPALEQLESYILEVSSPGLFRELKTEREYAFYQGKRIALIATTKKKTMALPLREGFLERFDTSSQTVYVLPREGAPASEAVAIPLSSQGGITITLNPVVHWPEDDEEDDTPVLEF